MSYKLNSFCKSRPNKPANRHSLKRSYPTARTKSRTATPEKRFQLKKQEVKSLIGAQPESASLINCGG